MRTASIRTALFASAFLTAAPFSATAGPIDTPIPDGFRSIFIVPGVIKNNDLETVIMCTNLEKSGTHAVAVEVFGPDGSGPLNDVTPGSANGAQDVGAGGTVTITTGNLVGISEDEVISGLGVVSHGSARVLSEARKLACYAFAADELSQPPTSMVNLPMIARRKQNGD